MEAEEKAEGVAHPERPTDRGPAIDNKGEVPSPSCIPAYRPPMLSTHCLHLASAPSSRPPSQPCSLFGDPRWSPGPSGAPTLTTLIPCPLASTMPSPLPD
ncbi:hypothetical protein L7F22_006576 [Adiantum nelumboides]|nr:hypothetical protein [Adiantum nelumboides]